MTRIFDQFQYRLNLSIGPSTQQPFFQQNQCQNEKFISVFINQQTNALEIAAKLCKDHNLDENLTLALAQSIQQEIEIQINQKKLKRGKSSSKGKSNKSKNFKNKFCSYLNQAQAEDLNQAQAQDFNSTQTFRNNDFVINPHFLNSPLKTNQYSFRPTYQKILQMTDDRSQQNFQINQFSINQSILQSKMSIQNQTTNSFKNNDRTVFDHLYQNFKLIEQRKEDKRKKSFEKLPFKPQLNKMSKKIIEIKKQLNPQYSSIWNRTEKKQNIQLCKKINMKSGTKLNKSNIKVGNASSKLQKQNVMLGKSQSKVKISKDQINLTIYQRGQIYRKKSQQKLNKIKENQMMNEMKICTFKPKIIEKNKNILFSRLSEAQNSFIKQHFY